MYTPYDMHSTLLVYLPKSNQTRSWLYISTVRIDSKFSIQINCHQYESELHSRQIHWQAHIRAFNVIILSNQKKNAVSFQRLNNFNRIKQQSYTRSQVFECQDRTTFGNHLSQLAFSAYRFCIVNSCFIFIWNFNCVVFDHQERCRIVLSLYLMLWKNYSSKYRYWWNRHQNFGSFFLWLYAREWNFRKSLSFALDLD